MKTHAWSLLASAALACTLPAQLSKTIPAAAAKAGNSSSPYFSGYGGGRMQQIVDGQALCRTTALLREVRLRADGTRVLSARKFTRVKLSVGLAATKVQTMTASFASNRKGTQTVVFDQAYNLPAQTSARPFNIVFKFRAPFTYVRNNGDLLLEWEVPQAPTKANYFFDAHMMASSGGTGRFAIFGQAGAFRSAEKYTVSSSAARLIPGGQAALLANGLGSAYPAVPLWGFSKTSFGALKLPFELSPLQAPKNWLNVSIDLAFPLPLRASGSAFAGTAALPIPKQDALVGLTIHGQALFVDPKSNARGWVLSQGVSMTVGSPSSQVTRHIGHWDSTSATGFISRTVVGHVLQFSGIYN